MRTAFDRRRLLKAGSLGAMAFTFGGCEIKVTPKEAKTIGADYNSLSDVEKVTLDFLGDILVPGAKDAGFSHYIDAQVSSPAGESLSLLKYMDWPPPFKGFYSSGVTALNAYAEQENGDAFYKLDKESATAIIGKIAGAQPDIWLNSAPPAPLFYFVTRSDAVDVFYGTQEGFEKLDVPYLPHITPSANW